MSSTKVIVITAPELGWDCVIGVYGSRAALRDAYFFTQDGEEGPKDSDLEEALENMNMCMFNEIIEIK